MARRAAAPSCGSWPSQASVALLPVGGDERRGGTLRRPWSPSLGGGPRRRRRRPGCGGGPRPTTGAGSAGRWPRRPTTAARISTPRMASRQNSLTWGDAHQALVEQVDEHGAEHRADQGARPAQHADPADHRRRHRVQLEPLAGDDGDGAEPGQEQEAGEPRQRPAADEGAQHEPPGRAGRPGRRPRGSSRWRRDGGPSAAAACASCSTTTITTTTATTTRTSRPPDADERAGRQVDHPRRAASRR